VAVGSAEQSARDERETWFATKSLEAVKQAALATVAQWLHLTQKEIILRSIQKRNPPQSFPFWDHFWGGSPHWWRRWQKAPAQQPATTGRMDSARLSFSGGMEVTSQQRVSTRTVEADSTTSPRSSQTTQSKNGIKNADFVQSQPLQNKCKMFSDNNSHISRCASIPSGCKRCDETCAVRDGRRSRYDY